MSARTGICYNMAHSGHLGTPANRFVSGWGLGVAGDYTRLAPDPTSIAEREIKAERPAPDLVWWQPQGTSGDGYHPDAMFACIRDGQWRLLESWQSLVIEYLDEFPETVSIAHIGRQGKNGVYLSESEMTTFESFYFVHDRMGVSFDNLGSDEVDASHESVRWAFDLLERGHLVLAEPIAKPDQPHTIGLPCISRMDYVLNQVSGHPKASHPGDLPGYLEDAKKRHGFVYVRGIPDRFGRLSMTMAAACAKAGVGFAWPAQHERWEGDAG